jgi:hypothetical protein
MLRRSMDGNRLLASLFLGLLGLGIFLFGKRQGRLPHLVLGLGLLVSTYFVSSIPLMFLIGAVSLALLWALVRLGW